MRKPCFECTLTYKLKLELEIAQKMMAEGRDVHYWHGRFSLARELMRMDENRFKSQ